jgi:uncharacterized protein YndB with AHSA1/START domain
MAGQHAGASTRVSKIIKARPEELYDAFMNPAALASDREDRVNVRFVELARPRRIVEAITFDTTDPAFLGEMTVVATFEETLGGTEVTLLCENLPPGLRAEDNEAGSRLSLEQLARRFE